MPTAAAACKAEHAWRREPWLWQWGPYQLPHIPLGLHEASQLRSGLPLMHAPGCIKRGRGQLTTQAAIECSHAIHLNSCLPSSCSSPPPPHKAGGVKRPQVAAARLAINNQLRQRLARGGCIEDAPARVRCGNVGIVEAGNAPNDGHAVAAGGQEAGLLLQHLCLAQLLHTAQGGLISYSMPAPLIAYELLHPEANRSLRPSGACPNGTWETEAATPLSVSMAAGCGCTSAAVGGTGAPSSLQPQM